MQANIEEKREFSTMLKTIWSLYSKEITPDVIGIYWNALIRFDLIEVRKALNLHVQNPDAGQFVPKPADLIRVLEGSNQNAAAVAWSKIVKAIGKVGPYRDVVFDDPIIHAVLTDMGGWITINGMSDHDMPFRGNEFEKRYQGYSIRGSTDDYPRLLSGMERLHNEKEGFDLHPPVLIGNQEMAEIVYRAGNHKPGLLVTTASSKLIGDSVKKITFVNGKK